MPLFPPNFDSDPTMEVGKVRRRSEWESSGDVAGPEKLDSSSSSDCDTDELMGKFFKTSKDEESDDESDDDIFCCCGSGKMTSEQFSKHSQQVRESEGFDIDPLPAVIFTRGLIVPIIVTDFCIHLAEFAIQRNKEIEGNNLKLVRVIKCNWEDTAPEKYYITFEAEDLNTGRVSTYQTKVVLMVPEEESQVTVFRVGKGPPPA